MDRQFGKLFDHVRNNKKLRDNSLILICSDNGFEPGAGRAGILKGYKTNLYEGGIRSPLIVWGPGFVNPNKAGTRNTTSVFSAIDLTPSLQRLTGAQAPKDAVYDGEDVLATLLGKSDVSRKQPIFFRRPPDRKNFYGFKNLPDLAVRDKQWKLLCDYDGSRPELYDLEKDPGETNNLASKNPSVVEQLTEPLVQWHQAMPKDNGPALGTK